MIGLSYFAAEDPKIKELDINPLLDTPNEVISLDARMLINKKLVGKDIKPYSHLALRPYPEGYVRTTRLKDSTNIILRLIKPEDEPMWMDMLASCSKESIY